MLVLSLGVRCCFWLVQQLVSVFSGLLPFVDAPVGANDFLQAEVNDAV